MTENLPPPPDSNPEVCPICRGAGYLLDQGYGYTEMPADAVPVQRCDACDRYPGDINAAHAAARDLGTSYGAHLDADGNTITNPDSGEEMYPGDAWVRLPEDREGLPTIPIRMTAASREAQK